MRFDLRPLNRGGIFSCTSWWWPRILRLMQTRGRWRPELERSLPPDGRDPDDWNGNLSTNDGQLVTAETALRMADALMLVLPQLPANPDPQVLRAARLPGAWAPTLLLALLAEHRAYLERLETFLRASGGFRIW